MPHRSLVTCPLAVAAAGAVLAACGQSTPSPSPSPTIPATCSTPSGFVFTDGAAHAAVTPTSPTNGSTQTTGTTQTINVKGMWTDQFDSSRPNERFDPTAFRGAPWLNVNIGSSSRGVVVEIEGQDPCALSPDASHSYVAVVLGMDTASRYGGNCSVKVDAFNSVGFRGSFNCTTLTQFGSGRSLPQVAAQGTFSATGHVYSPTAGPTPTPTSAPTSAATAAPTPTPTQTPAATLGPTVTP